MKKLILFSLVLSISFIVGLGYFSNNAFAATNTTPTYTQWAGTKAGSDGINPTPVLTAIGVGGDFPQCSLFIKTAPVVNGQVDFKNVSGWKQENCPNGGSGNYQGVSDYNAIGNPNAVVSGWNFSVFGNTNTPVCYSQESALLDSNNKVDISNIKSYSTCNAAKGILIPKKTITVPGSVIVGIGLSVSPGLASVITSKVLIPPPPAVAQVEPPVTPGGSNITTPISTSQSINAETNKIVQLLVSNAVSEGEAYQWDLISGSGAYIPKDPSRYSAGQNVSFDSQYFNGISSGARITAGPFLKVAFSDASNLKKIKVTKGTLETNFTVTVTQPSVAAPILGCTATPAEVKVGERVTATAFGTDTGVGNYNWSLPSDGRIISGGNTYNPLFSFSGAGQKAISVSHTVSGSTITASSCTVVNVTDAPTVTDLCSNISGAQSALPAGMKIGASGKCVVPPSCTANPYPFTAVDVSGAIKQVFLVDAKDGDGQNYTWQVFPDGDINSVKLNSSNSIAIVYDNPEQAVNKSIVVTSDGLISACRLRVSANPPPPAPIECGVVPNPNETDFFTKILGQTGLGKAGKVTNVKASGGDSRLYNWFSFPSQVSLDEKDEFGTMSSISISRDSTLFSAIFNYVGFNGLYVKSGGLTKLCPVTILGQSSTPEIPVVADVTPSPTKLTCKFKPDSISQQKPLTSIKVEASGGDGTYKWELLTKGSLTSSSSNPTWAIFSDSGSNSVKVTDGKNNSAYCSVTLFSEEVPPPGNDVCPNLNGNQTTIPNGLIKDAAGNCVTPGEPIIIEGLPDVACFSVPTQADIGQEVIFTATGGDNNYEWDNISESGAIKSSQNNTATARFDNPGQGIVMVSSAGSSITCNVDVATPPQPLPTVSIWAIPTEVPLSFDGLASYDISWSSTDAESCSAYGDWSIEDGSTSGSRPITKSQAGTYSYGITCVNSSGSASKGVSVTVIQKPQCEFTADPASITPPESSKLSWECKYASSCLIEGIKGISDVSLKDSIDVNPKETTTYTISCDGFGTTNKIETKIEIGFIPWLKEIIPLW